MTTETPSRNVEMVRRSLEAMEGGNRDAFRELIDQIAHPEVEWTPLIGTGVEGSYQGREQIANFFEDFVGSFEVRYEDREIRAFGDRFVLLLARMRLKGRESGVEVDQELGSVYEFEDGLLRRGRAYPTHEEALAAAEAVNA
jgi:ketosteroid isomerase-like protein